MKWTTEQHRLHEENERAFMNLNDWLCRLSKAVSSAEAAVYSGCPLEPTSTSAARMDAYIDTSAGKRAICRWIDLKSMLAASGWRADELTARALKIMQGGKHLKNLPPIEKLPRIE